MTLHWKGDAVVARVERDAAAAMVETVDEAVIDARAETPVLTGAARDSLTREDDGLTIHWGYHVAHGLWLEIGARGKAGLHAMRRAADRHYPRLAGRIGRGSR